MQEIEYRLRHRYLDLVYNPDGASLPAAQADLEEAYKAELAKRFGVVFSSLRARRVPS